LTNFLALLRGLFFVELAAEPEVLPGSDEFHLDEGTGVDHFFSLNFQDGLLHGVGLILARGARAIYGAVVVVGVEGVF